MIGKRFIDHPDVSLQLTLSSYSPANSIETGIQTLNIDFPVALD